MQELSTKAQATREKILRAANELFYQHGYNGTGLDRIIAEAGVAKGSFYHHFKSKEGLATAVVEWHRDLAFQEIDLDRILAEPSPFLALLHLLERMTGRMMDDRGPCQVRGCLFGNLALELATTSAPVRRKLQQVFDGMRELIRDLLVRAREAGEIRIDLDPEKTAGLILGLMEGAVLLDKTSQTARETRNAVDFVRSYLSA
jgi:TetR/AcrR family transcriptional repressor of nem operon